MISELDEKLWIITCSFLPKNANLFLPFLCEGEHHIVPLRMNILCQIQSVFFSWWFLRPEELFRSHFLFQKEEVWHFWKTRTHKCFAWSKIIANGLGAAYYTPFMYHVPYLRLQDWWVLGLSSVYAVALSFQSALTVIWPVVGKDLLFSSLIVLTLSIVGRGVSENLQLWSQSRG